MADLAYALDFDSAGDISITEGGSTIDIVAALADAAHITGIITAEDGGFALEDIQVCAYYFDGQYWQGAGSCDHTDSAGDFDVAGLPAGTFRLGYWGYDSMNCMLV